MMRQVLNDPTTARRNSSHLLALSDPLRTSWTYHQALRLVLSYDTHAPNARVDAVAQWKVDDAQLASERHRRFRAIVGELFQSAAAPSCQHRCIGLLRDCAQERRVRLRLQLAVADMLATLRRFGDRKSLAGMASSNAGGRNEGSIAGRRRNQFAWPGTFAGSAASGRPKRQLLSDRHGKQRLPFRHF